MQISSPPEPANRYRRPTASLLWILLTLCSAPLLAQSPWDLLQEMRGDLEADGPVTARFQQTYIPAGFSSGDQESGHFSLWLPKCLRWNYEEPAGKSFLLCEGQVHLWNHDEPSGKRYQVDAEQEPGLDLLLVPVDELQQRYSASSKKLENGLWEISLKQPGEAGFSARIQIDPTIQRVLTLEYTDDEGSLTRFQISDYSQLSHVALFRAPEDIEWIDEP